MENAGGSGARRVRLQGPKPAELAVSKESAKIKKKVRATSHSAPVIVYLRSPKVIHVRPEEFMDLVQKLTGKSDQTAQAEPSPDVSSPSSLLWLSSPSPSSSVEYHCG
ncbi:hypothetical protein BT93_K1033 [Corymbia citriodora subsp. variegata]|nr:hypothetical protein BT93_K1033 [Corymbia citriodora subsp. variegata]